MTGNPTPDYAATARNLMRRAISAALATAQADAQGHPYGSLVTVTCDTDASPILLFSELADHTRNLARDSRASLLFDAAAGLKNPQTGGRVSVQGRIEKTTDERHRRRFLARHPSAAAYAGFGDFHFYRMAVDRAHYVGGFGKTEWIDGADLLFDGKIAAAIAEAETDVIGHMNKDHVDSLAAYANRLLGRRGKRWKMIGVDPEGVDLSLSGKPARLDFDSPVGNRQALRDKLVELAGTAEGRPENL